MPRIFHLSDLHLANEANEARAQTVIFDRLVDTVRRERAAAPEDRIAVAMTGDLFDSASDPVDAIVEDALVEA
jgi:DNA repair exonuclease SbcCD nuclease subunit